MKKYQLLLLSLLLAGCVSEDQISRSQNTFLRRMPQINRIDPGKPLEKGSFAASLSGSYSLKRPDVMVATDSSFESRSSLFGDELTIITSSRSYCYESRAMASGDAMYGYYDFMAFGLSLDAALGTIESPVPSSVKTIFNDAIEGSVFCRFAKKFGPLAVAIRPEFVLAHVYGDKITSEVSGDPNHPITATDQINSYILSIRSSSVLRYDITKPFSVFAAITVKSQPYPSSSSEIHDEVAYGIYGGCDVQYLNFSFVPYVTIPLGSEVSHFTSPVAAGVQLSFRLTEK